MHPQSSARFVIRFKALDSPNLKTSKVWSAKLQVLGGPNLKFPRFEAPNFEFGTALWAFCAPLLLNVVQVLHLLRWFTHLLRTAIANSDVECIWRAKTPTTKWHDEYTYIHTYIHIYIYMFIYLYYIILYYIILYILYYIILYRRIITGDNDDISQQR